MGIRKASSVPQSCKQTGNVHFLHLVIVAATSAFGAGGSNDGAIGVFNIGLVRHSDFVDVRVYNLLVNCDSDLDRHQVSLQVCPIPA